MKSILGCVFLCICLVLLTPLPGPAQVGTQASLFGTVTDSSGGTVAGAIVTATNISTNAVHTALSDKQGNFDILALPIGTYRVTVQAAGFKRWENAAIQLTVGDQSHLAPTLQVGAGEETVTVVSTTEAIQTERAAVESVVQMQQIRELPLDSRNPLELVGLTPGMVVAGVQTGGEKSTYVQGNGLRSNKTAFQLDGIDTNAPMDEGGSGVPNVDTIAEFSVQTSNFTAESGRAPLQVLVVTKSGTNAFHGTIFEFFQNDLFNAKNAFAVRKDRVRYNQFGGTLGGPIIKNKTFFFASFQGTVARNSNVFNVTVPTEQMKLGNFNGLAFNNPCNCLIDPTTGSPFPGNLIPANRIDRSSAYFLPMFLSANALPNAAGGTFKGNAAGSVKTWETTVRIDHQITAMQRLYGRYVNSRQPVVTFFDPVSGSADPRHAGSDDVTQHNLSLNYSWAFSANKLLEISGGMFHTREQYANPAFGKQNDTQLAGVQGFPTDVRKAWIGPPQIDISGYTSFAFGGGFGTPGSLWGSTYNGKASFDYIHAAHHLDVGVEYGDRRTYAGHGSSASRGEFAFNNNYTGNAFADYLLGYISGTTRNVPLAEFGNDRAPYLAAYTQDNWRVRTNLTLNLGVRYERWLAHHNVNDAATAWDPALNKIVLAVDSHGNPNLNVFPGITPALAAATARLWVTSIVARYPRGLYQPNGHWSPRLGLTYRPFAKRQIVLRTGFGSYYNSFTGNRGASMINVPHWTQESLSISPTTLQKWESIWPVQPVGFTAFFVNAPNAFVKPVRTDEWNVSVQTALPGKSSLTVAYVGNRSPNEISAHEYNAASVGPHTDIQADQPQPLFSNIQVYENLGRSWYHGLQVKAERRFQDGLSFGAAYSFSRSMVFRVANDEFGSIIPFAPDSYNRQRSNLDRRHIESATAVWQLPYGHGRRFGNNSHRTVNGLLGGWQVSFIQTAESGVPLSIDSGQGTLGNGFGVRARLVGNPHVAHPTTARWFNTGAFVLPTLYSFSDAAAFGILEGPGVFQINSGVFKEFHVSETKYVQFRWETYNLTNRVNLSNPDTNLSDTGLFGTITGAGPSRNMQFGLKFIF